MFLSVYPIKTHLMQTPFVVLFPALLAAFTLNASGADKVTLRQHWEPGKLYKQENVTDMSMVMPGLGAAGEQKTNIIQSLTVGVTKDPGSDNKSAEVKFAAIKGSMTMMGQVMTYDSNDPAKSQPFLQQAFGAMVGKSFTIVYDKDDKFVSVKGIENLAPTPLGKTQAMDGKQLAEAFRKSSEMGLPKDPVAVGDTWKVEEKMDLPPIGKLVIKATGKFDSLATVKGANTAKLLITGEFSTEGDNQLVNLGEGSKFDAEVLFDLDRKVVVNNVTNTTLKLNVGGKEAPMTQKVTTALTGIEDLK